MNRRTTLLVLLFVVTSAVFAVAGPLSASAQQDGTDDSADGGPTEISSCTTIETPGSYVLTENVTNSEGGTCLSIGASDVTLDGQGHAVVGPDALIDLSTGIEVTSHDETDPVTNVTLENVTVDDWHVGVEFTADDSRISDVNVAGSFLQGIRVAEHDVTVADSTVTGTYFGAGLRVVGNEQGDGVRVTVVNNTFVRNDAGIDAQAVTDARFANNTVADSASYGSEEPNSAVVSVDGSDVTFTDNTVRNTSVKNGVYFNVEDGTVTGNTIRNVAGDGLVAFGSETMAAHNTVRNASSNGIVAASIQNVTLSRNRIVDSTTGIRVGSYLSADASVADVTVVRNTVTNNQNGVVVDRNPSEVSVHRNDLSANSEYGIDNRVDGQVLNATHNYWGDGGPSSHWDVTLHDPVTGEPADGNGSAVSAGDADCVSNVHFDPWLDASLSNETAG